MRTYYRYTTLFTLLIAGMGAGMLAYPVVALVLYNQLDMTAWWIVLGTTLLILIPLLYYAYRLRTITVELDEAYLRVIYGDDLARSQIPLAQLIPDEMRVNPSLFGLYVTIPTRAGRGISFPVDDEEHFRVALMQALENYFASSPADALEDELET